MENVRWAILLTGNKFSYFAAACKVLQHRSTSEAAVLLDPPWVLHVQQAPRDKACITSLMLERCTWLTPSGSECDEEHQRGVDAYSNPINVETRG